MNDSVSTTRGPENFVVGFTGTRGPLRLSQLERLCEVVKSLKPTEFHHGDCIGADAKARALAVALGIPVVIHPPDKDYLRANCKGAKSILKPLPYLERNKAIVDASDYVIACPRTAEEEKRSGTWQTIRYARKVGKALLIIEPKGEARLAS
jgi:hypothetical protein